SNNSACCVSFAGTSVFSLSVLQSARRRGHHRFLACNRNAFQKFVGLGSVSFRSAYFQRVDPISAQIHAVIHEILLLSRAAECMNGYAILLDILFSETSYLRQELTTKASEKSCG